MIAIDRVNVVPVVLAMPAGLSPIASPLSVDATAAPARDVEIAPEPGKYRPPALAALLVQTATPVTTTATLRIARTYRATRGARVRWPNYLGYIDSSWPMSMPEP